jgi:hypothetical protein
VELIEGFGVNMWTVGEGIVLGVNKYSRWEDRVVLGMIIWTLGTEVE